MSNDKPKKDVLAELRSAIGQQIKPHAAPPSPPAAPAEKPVATPAAARKPAGRHRTTASAEPAAPTRSGRGVQFYLEDSDRKIINSLAVWFASQDRRLSETAIRLAAAQQNSRLLEIAETVRSGDRRRQPKGTAKKPPRRV